MSYAKYQSQYIHTKSGDDQHIVSRLFTTTVGCMALFIASVTTTCGPELRPAFANSTRPTVISNADVQEEQISESSTISVDAMTTQIKDLFGVNVSDLAKVIGVSRPTAYKYLSEEGPTDTAIIERIHKMHELAELWGSLTTRPISRELKRSYPDSPSLIDIISADPVDYAFAAKRIHLLARLSEKRTVNSADFPKNYAMDNINNTIENLVSTVS